MYYFLLVLFIISCLFLILVVLVQRGGSDVGTAFGGMGQGAFGPGGVDTILTKMTLWLGLFIVALAILLNLLYPSKKSVFENEGKGPVKSEQGLPKGQTAPAGTPSEQKTR
ncbi:preprotein translocase subunit SecG [Thermocrinis minervae]|uniref:Protein-export membrane protein SecG n=1 Tax=Thermocrinis minervae TaxID=381751 RepID=A0A1M6SJN5_9AQUI|nr:preprotein translocase subunit SecG [Thermocrinis minervae]SHK44951.1 protein translocase subunit secG [Thermocrinis minervae]